jgi:anti-sigma factor RsiW
MEITCLQMDVLLSFYIDEDLSDALKEKVEKHLEQCTTCRAKYNIIRSLFTDMRKEASVKQKNEMHLTSPHSSHQYQFFKNNLSAYIDNELPEEENVKIKKYTITNKKARKDLEDTYNIRKLMKASFRKTKSETKPDFSKNIIKYLSPEERNDLSFNPLISVGFAFVLSVLLISAIVIYILSLPTA